MRFLEVFVDPVALYFLCVEPVDFVVCIDLDNWFFQEFCVVLVEFSGFAGIELDHNLSVLLERIFEPLVHHLVFHL